MLYLCWKNKKRCASKSGYRVKASKCCADISNAGERIIFGVVWTGRSTKRVAIRVVLVILLRRCVPVNTLRSGCGISHVCRDVTFVRDGAVSCGTVVSDDSKAENSRSILSRDEKLRLTFYFIDTSHSRIIVNLGSKIISLTSNIPDPSPLDERVRFSSIKTIAYAKKKSSLSIEGIASFFTVMKSASKAG